MDDLKLRFLFCWFVFVKIFSFVWLVVCDGNEDSLERLGRLVFV